MNLWNSLSPHQASLLIENMLSSASKVSEKELNSLVSNYPFKPGTQKGEKNPNYYALMLFRRLREFLPVDELAGRLNMSPEYVEELLSAEGYEAFFPVSDGRNSFLNKAFVVPLSIPESLSTEPVSESLKTLSALSRKNFFVVFERSFDFESSSYMLALYSSLLWGKEASSLAFTGVLSEDGTIEEVKFLEAKLKACREEGKPLVYPSACMSSIDDLRRFMEELEIPLCVLPSMNTSDFAHSFPFSPEYLAEVFNIRNELLNSREFNETPESFEEFRAWMDSVAQELKRVYSLFSKFRVAFTSSVLVMSFYGGLSLSKKRLPASFYSYDSSTNSYRPLYLLDSDILSGVRADVRDSLDIRKTGERIKRVYVYLKGEPNKLENSLLISSKTGSIDESKVKETAYLISSEIRKTNIDNAELHLQGPNSLFFALGYYLEDYKNLTLMHKGVPVYTIKEGCKGKLYLLNAFSLNMLPEGKSIVEVESIDLERAKALLEEKGFESYISHQSTAQALSELLHVEVPFNRQSFTFTTNSCALVFQIKRRPAEGQVFSKEEVESILKEGLYSIRLVRVYVS